MKDLVLWNVEAAVALEIVADAAEGDRFYSRTLVDGVAAREYALGVEGRDGSCYRRRSRVV